MYWHILLPVRTKHPVSCESMINYSYVWMCVCACLCVHLLKKFSWKIRVDIMLLGNDVSQSGQRPKWVERPVESGFRGISAQRNGNLIRAKPSTTVSKTVSYSMVSPSIKPTLQQSVKLNDLFLVRTHCPMEKRTPCLLAANWLRWFRWTGQGELLMRACCRLKAKEFNNQIRTVTHFISLCVLSEIKKKVMVRLIQ